MLMLVCFRCIDVFTYEEGHRCLPSSDDEDINGTEHLLLIDYERVNFRHDLTKSNRDTCIETSGGNFNSLSATIPVGSHNEYYSCLPSIEQSSNQASDGKLNLLEQNRSLSANNSVSPSESSLSMRKPTFNKCQQNGKVTRSLDLKASSSSQNPAEDFYQLEHFESVNEAPEQEDHPSQQQELIERRENACAPLEKRWPLSTTYSLFICEQCGSGFRDEDIFKAHVQSNCDPKPLRCDQCPSKFRFKYKLTQHLRAHAGEKLFQCDQCPYASKWKRNLKRHNEMVHH